MGHTLAVSRCSPDLGSQSTGCFNLGVNRRPGGTIATAWGSFAPLATAIPASSAGATTTGSPSRTAGATPRTATTEATAEATTEAGPLGEFELGSLHLGPGGLLLFGHHQFDVFLGLLAAGFHLFPHLGAFFFTQIAPETTAGATRAGATTPGPPRCGRAASRISAIASF